MSSPMSEAIAVSGPPSPAPAPAPPLITTTPSLPPKAASPQPATAVPTTLLAPPSSSSTSTAGPAPAPSSLKRKASFEEFEMADDPFLDEESAAFKASKSASEWNAHLKWGRQVRGPQWEWGTGMYHVPVGSAEYYAGVIKLAEGSAVPGHLRQETATHTPTPGSPGTPGGSVTVSAGTYDSGRPRRTRAANYK